VEQLDATSLLQQRKKGARAYMTNPLQSPRQILLIEDDWWIRTCLRDVLSDEGYTVIEAADGRTGLRLAAEECPDLVLLDLAMPEFTGMEVLHELRRGPMTRTVPVVILSAFARLLTAPDATSVAGVVSKPVDMAMLLAAVKDALDARAEVRPNDRPCGGHRSRPAD
jgi:CheY-like chemotaxis protein